MKTPEPLLIGGVACDCFERGKGSPPLPQWGVHVGDDGRAACDSSDPAELAQFQEWRGALCDCEHGCVATEVMFDSDVLLEIRRELSKHRTEFPSLLRVFLDLLPKDGTVLDRTIIASADWRELDYLHAVSSGSSKVNARIRKFGKGVQKLIVLSGVFDKPIFFFSYTPGGPGTLYVSRLAKVWDAIDFCGSEHDFLEQFASADVVDRNLFAAHWCQAEVLNGGFSQYFRNSTGMMAPEALHAFQEIGLRAWENSLQSAMAFFGPAYPRDRIKRLAALPPANATSIPSPFATMDAEFNSPCQSDPDFWRKAADAYVQKSDGAMDESSNAPESPKYGS